MRKAPVGVPSAVVDHRQGSHLGVVITRAASSTALSGSVVILHLPGANVLTRNPFELLDSCGRAHKMVARVVNTAPAQRRIRQTSPEAKTL